MKYQYVVYAPMGEKADDILIQCGTAIDCAILMRGLRRHLGPPITVVKDKGECETTFLFIFIQFKSNKGSSRSMPKARCRLSTADFRR